MDDRLRREVLGFIEGLAIREKDRLAALGTFAEIEDLTVEIGDEVARQLARFELTRRAEAMTESGVHACPDCGKEAEVEAVEDKYDLRWNWNTPFFISPHDRFTFYTAANKVMRSTERSVQRVPS